MKHLEQITQHKLGQPNYLITKNMAATMSNRALGGLPSQAAKQQLLGGASTSRPHSSPVARASSLYGYD